MNEAELKAQRDAARIVRITNPFDFDYTHAWGGVPYTLPVGKPLLFPYPLGLHLATHLARQALIRKAPMRDANEIDGKGKDRPLWSEESIQELIKTIMVEEYTEEIKAPVSEAELMARKIAELQKQFDDFKGGAPANNTAGTTPATIEPAAAAPAEPAAPVVSVTDEATAQVDPENTVYKDKAEVIAELTKRGIKFDARKNKTELEKLLA